MFACACVSVCSFVYYMILVNQRYQKNIILYVLYVPWTSLMLDHNATTKQNYWREIILAENNIQKEKSRLSKREFSNLFLQLK